LFPRPELASTTKRPWRDTGRGACPSDFVFSRTPGQEIAQTRFGLGTTMTKMLFKLINRSIKKRTGYSLSKLDVAAAAKLCTAPVLLGCANADKLISPLHRCASCPFAHPTHSAGQGECSGVAVRAKATAGHTGHGKSSAANPGTIRSARLKRRQSSRATQLPQRHHLALSVTSYLGSV